jgi:hypothetical protein
MSMTVAEGEAEMSEQRVPNLEEMDQQETHNFLDELFPTSMPERNTRYSATHNLGNGERNMAVDVSGRSVRFLLVSGSGFCPAANSTVRRPRCRGGGRPLAAGVGAGLRVT